DGNAQAGYGVYVTDDAGYDSVTVSNGAITRFQNNGLFIHGGIGSATLSHLVLNNNGTSGEGGSGDIQFWMYHGDAALSDLTLMGNATTRLGIQFRGVGDGDGVSEQPAGTIIFSNIDISGTYRTQMI